MKKHLTYKALMLFFIIIGLNPLFAQTAKDKYNSLNDYFETIVKDTSKTIIIRERKIQNNETIEMFKLNDIWSIDLTGMERLDKKLYKEADWKTMKHKYKNFLSLKKEESIKREFWKKKDFKYKKITLENLISGKADFEKKYALCPVYDMYSFSEPIYYKKTYLVFTVYKSDIIGGGSVYIVIMKKENDKWVVTHKGYNPNIMN